MMMFCCHFRTCLNLLKGSFDLADVFQSEMPPIVRGAKRYEVVQRSSCKHFESLSERLGWLDTLSDASGVALLVPHEINYGPTCSIITVANRKHDISYAGHQRADFSNWDHLA